MKTKVQKITWKDGVCTIKYEKIGKVVSFDKADFMPEIRAHAEEHGFEQRFGDLESGDKVGEAKFQAATALKQQYMTSKDWTRAAERDTLTELLQAVEVVLDGQFTIEELQEAVKADPEQVAEWREDNYVRLELAKMRQAKAAARVAADPKSKLVVKGLK